MCDEAYSASVFATVAALCIFNFDRRLAKGRDLSKANEISFTFIVKAPQE